VEGFAVGEGAVEVEDDGAGVALEIGHGRESGWKEGGGQGWKRGWSCAVWLSAARSQADAPAVRPYLWQLGVARGGSLCPWWILRRGSWLPKVSALSPNLARVAGGEGSG
jgi:hypothetical protein